MAKPKVPPPGTTVPIFVSPDRTEFDDLAGIRRELEDALSPGIEIIRPLGRGGMGAVFLARDLALKRQVVVKVLSPDKAQDATAVQRFAREAESAAAVSHPNVVGVFQVGVLPKSGTSYFVMQFVDGPSLDQACPMGTKVLQARCRRIIGEVASALGAAHARGLVHRDIKPGNVILEGPTERAIVVDFGISAAAAPEPSTRLTETGTSIGTPEYMSPEQAAGHEVTAKSDVYSLGVLAFELLTGRMPFDESSALALMAAHMKDPAPRVGTLRPDLDSDFADLVDRMLAKAPPRRPPAMEIARALLPGTHVVEWPPPGLERLRGRGARSMRWLLLATAALGVYFLALTLRLRDPLWWALLNTAAALVGLVAVTTAGIALGMTGRLLHWSRQSGYPFRVAFDVALDAYFDTTALLNGTGRFASLPEGTGWRWLERRRWAAGALLIGAFGTVTLVAFWAAGVLMLGTPRSMSFAGLADTAVIFSPTLLAAVVAAVLRFPEMSIRGDLRPVGEGRRRKRRLVQRDLVTGWLTSVGWQVPPPPAPSGWDPVGWRLVVLLPAVLLLLAAFGLGGSLLAAIFLPRAADRGSAEALLELRAQAGDWRAVDGVVGRTARAAGGRRDLAAARALIAERDSGPVDPELAWSAFRALPGRLPDSMRAALAAGNNARMLALWTRVGASARLPALWYAPTSATAGDSLAALGRQLAAVQRLAWRHAGRAALALESGDRRRAVTRVRQIIALGRLLWSDPLPAAYLRGAGVLDVGARALAAIATVTGDRSLARESDALRATLDGRRLTAAQLNRRNLGRHGASPLDTLLPALAGDRGLAPVDRWAAIAVIADGACWNPAEIRRGVSLARIASLARAAEQATDIGHTNEWVGEQRRALERFETARGLNLELSAWSVLGLKPVLRSAWCSGVRGGG